MYKILIVEDEYYIREGIRDYVLNSGLNLEICSEASNGISGFDEALKEKPDIIICDINMPAVNGLDMISKIKMYLPETIFIVLTGYRNFDYAQRAVKLNVFDYILKPIDTDELRKGLTKCVEYLDFKRKSKRDPKTEKNVSDEIYAKRNHLLGIVMTESDEEIMTAFEEYFTLLCSELKTDELKNAEIGALIMSLQDMSKRYDIHTDFIDQPLMKTNFDTESWKSVLKDILIHLSEIFQEKDLDNALVCQRITEYISKNYNKDIGSAEVVFAVTHLSKNYVSSMFKKQYGISIGEYINKVRILNAERILSETMLSIEDVAGKCGFINPKYFYALFRKYVGVSPGEYRKIHNKK